MNFIGWILTTIPATYLTFRLFTQWKLRWQWFEKAAIVVGVLTYFFTLGGKGGEDNFIAALEFGLIFSFFFGIIFLLLHVMALSFRRF